MKGILAAILLIWGFPAFSATFDLDIEITFDARKTSHECVMASWQPTVPETCGPFAGHDVGTVYSGSLSVSRAFEFSTGDGFTPASYSVSGPNLCNIGDWNCENSGWSNASGSTGSGMYLQPVDTSFLQAFTFDFAAGTGIFEWEDDWAPFWSKGRFELTDVRARGFALPFAAASVPQPVPLPAGLPLLVVGLSAFGLAGRFGRRNCSG